MAREIPTEAESALDRFVEGLFRLMLEHHQRNATEMELTLPQAQALRLLHGAPLSTSRLAGMLGISAPAVSQLTDRLVRKRLIERRAVETDRRSVMVGLTRKGAQVIEDIRRRRNQAFAEALSKLTDPDRAEVTATLAKLAAVLEPAESAPQVGQLTGGQPLRREPMRRTAVEPAGTSNEIGLAQVRLPPRTRMKIEWD